MAENSSQSRFSLICIATQGLLGKILELWGLMLGSEWHEFLWVSDYLEKGAFVTNSSASESSMN